jgi:hypothetical protein
MPNSSKTITVSVNCSKIVWTIREENIGQSVGPDAGPPACKTRMMSEFDAYQRFSSHQSCQARLCYQE